MLHIIQMYLATTPLVPMARAGSLNSDAPQGTITRTMIYQGTRQIAKEGTEGSGEDRLPEEDADIEAPAAAGR